MNIERMRELAGLNPLTEGKENYGSDGKSNIVVNISGVDKNFYQQPFGRQLDAWNKIKEWKKSARKIHVSAKHSATLAAVKKWISANNPKEVFATWQKDSANYKDDSVEVFYK
jgi:hypothetical protein